MTTWLRATAGVALLVIYALPLYAPPATPAVDATTIRHDLVTRLFPEVPAWWILTRLGALVAGAVLLSGRGAAGPAVVPGVVAGTASSRGHQLALAAAALHVASFFVIDALPAWGQTLYLAWLVVPALILRTTRETASPPQASPIPRATWATIGVLVAAWVALRVPVAHHSPRLADLVDMWRTFTGLGRLVGTGGNFLVDGIDPQLPGVNSTPLFFQGFSLLQMLGRAPSLAWVQAANTLWVAVGASATGVLAARVAGPHAAPVATAAILAAPFLLLAQMTPCVVFLGTLATSMVGLATVRFVSAPSPTALALLGGCAGLAATYPAVAPAVGVCLLVVLWRLAVGPRLPAAALVTAALSFAAAFLPSVPSPAEFQQMVQLYVKLDGHASTLQATIFGQLPSLAGASTGWKTGRTGAFDIPLAALLSPFATSRMALRLWGDGLYDPWTSALAAIGIATCVRRARRSPAAVLLLVILLATLITGFASSTDKPSLYRTFAAPVPIALLAAVGATALRFGHAGAAIAAIVMVASGIGVFDVVNGRILERSAPGLVLEALQVGPHPPAAMLTHPRENHGWLYQDVIAREVPAVPLPLVDHAAVDAAAAQGTALFFWSPAVEASGHVGAAACQRWPDGRHFVVHDPGHHSRVHAFRTAATTWQPALAASRWETVPCDADRRLPAAPVLR